MPDIFVPPSKSTDKPKEETLTNVDQLKQTPPKGRPENDIVIPESETNPIGIFTSFLENPVGLTFENQDPGEDILLFVRRHFITNIPWIIIAFLLLFMPFVVGVLFTAVPLFPFEFTPQAILILLLMYYLVVFGYTLVNFLHWFYNIGIVSEERVIDIDYSDIVTINVAATKVSQIEDVNYTQSGFLRTLFNYGDVFIQTAGNTLNFEFLRIPKPGKAVEIVHNLIGKK